MCINKLDSDAVEMIPIRFVISITVVAVIVGLVLVGLQSLSVTFAEAEVRNVCSQAIAEIETMFGGDARDVSDPFAAEGSKRSIVFDLPDSLVFLGFGVDPDPDGVGGLEPGVTADGCLLCFQVDGGGKQIIWCTSELIRFREGVFRDNVWLLGEEGFIVTGGGETMLTFELVQYQKEVFVLIQANDGITRG